MEMIGNRLRFEWLKRGRDDIHKRLEDIVCFSSSWKRDFDGDDSNPSIFGIF